MNTHTHLLAVALGLVEGLEDQRRSGGDHRHGRLSHEWIGETQTRQQAAPPTKAHNENACGTKKNRIWDMPTYMREFKKQKKSEKIIMSWLSQQLGFRFSSCIHEMKHNLGKARCFLSSKTLDQFISHVSVGTSISPLKTTVSSPVVPRGACFSSILSWVTIEANCGQNRRKQPRRVHAGREKTTHQKTNKLLL